LSIIILEDGDICGQCGMFQGLVALWFSVLKLSSALIIWSHLRGFPYNATCWQCCRCSILYAY